MASTEPSHLTADAGPLPDNITLRIIVLAHRTRSNDDLYLVLNLDTTIGALKERIRDSLPEQPSADRQRLIYQGRPLVNNDAVLRQVLRLDGNAVTTSHVLHLVIRDVNPDSRPGTTSILESVPQTTENGQANVRPPPIAAPSQTPAFPQMQQLPGMPQPGMPPAQLVELIHNQMHNQIHMMQHQMAVNNANRAHGRQHLGTHGQGGGGQSIPIPSHTNHNRVGFDSRAAPPAPGQGLPTMPRTPQVQQEGSGHLSNAMPPINNIPTPAGGSVQVQESIGPNGERIRTVINNGGMTFHVAHHGFPNPFERPASAPGLSPATENAPTNPPTLPQTGANNAQQASQSPIPPLPPGIHLPLMPSLRPSPFPFMGFPQMHPSMTAQIPTAAQHQPSQTMAWLLSTPSGPHAVVFAPGHGYFTSQRTQETSTLQGLQPEAAIGTHPNLAANIQRAPQPPTGLPPLRAQLVQARAQARPPPPERPQPANQGPAQREEANNNDIMNLVIQRGWLFLRLYMFIFVLSEPSTWQRFIMLSLAILVCILPRQNPATHLFAAIRRHIDNLIGPPELVQRQEQQPQQQQQEQRNPMPGNANDQRQGNRGTDQPREGNTVQTPLNNNSSARRMPTPEENARRLLREHEQRNPSALRDMLYRVEQATALFLASLIPGVGERHVRAREEARRIVEEEERRQREEQQRLEEQQQGNNDETSEAKEPVSTEPPRDQQQSAASSSAVDASDGAAREGVRARGGNASSPTAN